MVAIELVDPATGDPDAALTARIAAYAHARGVVLLTAGTFGNVLRFLPPLSIGDELLREGLSVVAEALETPPAPRSRTRTRSSPPPWPTSATAKACTGCSPPRGGS